MGPRQTTPPGLGPAVGKGRPAREDRRVEYTPCVEFDRITFDPQILGGRACIRGMRVPGSVVVSQIAHGATVEDVLADYPDLEREDVTQALEYAAWLATEQVVAG